MKSRIRTSFFKAPRHYQVPRGHRVHRSATGWDITDASGAAVRHFPAAAPIPADTNPNWLSYSDLTGSPVPPLAKFIGSWTVPDLPTNQNLSIFFFNGLEDAEGQNILQPVLQWGSTAHGAITGSWSIASWYAGSSNAPAFSSEAIPIDPGTALTGVMELNGAVWTCYFENFPGTTLVVDSVPDMVVAALTLEAYLGNAVPTDVSLGGPPVSFQVSDLTAAPGEDLSQTQWSPFGQWPAVVNTSTAQEGNVTIAYR